MMEGYIALHKSLLSWRWIDDPCAVCLWVQLLLRANYEDKNWHDTVIKRGQLVTTLGDLAKQTGLSMRQIRTRLDWLESAECINRQTTNKFTIITICKYDSYQCPKNENDKQTTNKRQTNDKQNDKQSDKQNVSATDYERGSYGDAKSESDKQNDKQKIGETTRLYNKERINNITTTTSNNAREEEISQKWQACEVVTEKDIPPLTDGWVEEIKLMISRQLKRIVTDAEISEHYQDFIAQEKSPYLQVVYSDWRNHFKRYIRKRLKETEVKNEKVTKGFENNIRASSSTLEIGKNFKPTFDF